MLHARAPARVPVDIVAAVAAVPVRARVIKVEDQAAARDSNARDLVAERLPVGMIKK